MHLGGSFITFSLGANDKQVLQPPLSSTIPITSSYVFELFNQLGIYAVVNIVIALMTENKVLILSRSYTQIYQACHALISLMYPFVYSHIYIPILPACLLDFVASPTPYLMGLHASLKSQTFELVSWNIQIYNWQSFHPLNLFSIDWCVSCRSGRRFSKNSGRPFNTKIGRNITFTIDQSPLFGLATSIISSG